MIFDPNHFLGRVDTLVHQTLDADRWKHVPYVQDSFSPPALARRLHRAGGKRIRPLLVYHGMTMAHLRDEYDLDRGVRLAAAVELLHLFGLLQDDIMDDASLRRGMPTAAPFVLDELGLRASEHPAARRHANSIAILAGDLCAALANEMVASEHPAIRRVWAELCSEMVLGQYADVVATVTGESDPDLLRRIASLKSGRYSIHLPLSLGVLVVDHDQDLTELAQACETLGVAFQLADDMRDHQHSVTSGKDQHLDAANGRITYADMFTGTSQSIQRSIEAAVAMLRNVGFDDRRLDDLQTLFCGVITTAA
ncbi:polyprenyl synthetase family protein [Nocardia sp. NBC_01499]|uniref:polyprenyl synthetase family protein n=1 Tax=Nocardia sp. NBC_01499 TaxID=2903597 RepID=UPI003870402F